MNTRLLAVARFATLLGTAYLLVATSRAPCSNNTPDTQSFAVSGNCGPNGTVEVTSTASCQLVVDGGEAVFLPAFGSQRSVGPIRGQSIDLAGSVVSLDGGTVPLSDGGLQEPSSCTGGECLRGLYRTCSSTVLDGGALTLNCSTGMDLCTSELTPVP